jgi:hypothetical protein
MMCFKIVTPHPADFQIPHEIAVLINAKSASATLEDGYAWFSLYDLRGKSLEDIKDLFEQFGRALHEQNVSIGPACAVCGGADGAELLFSEGKCSRICEPCLTALLEERERIEAERNRPSSLHSYALPWVVALAGVGWMVFWVVIDMILDALKTDTIAMPQLIVIAILAVVGLVLGAPLGHVLRRSGTGRKSPLIVSIIAISLAALFGETLYVTVFLFRLIGEFDLTLGFELLVPFLQSYHPSWITAKIIVAAAIAFGCYHSASRKDSVRLPI